jgi:hypothetical protein
VSEDLGARCYDGNRFLGVAEVSPFVVVFMIGIQFIDRIVGGTYFIQFSVNRRLVAHVAPPANCRPSG